MMVWIYANAVGWSAALDEGLRKGLASDPACTTELRLSYVMCPASNLHTGYTCSRTVMNTTQHNIESAHLLL